MSSAKGGWPVCDPVLRLAGVAYGGSKETSTTVCGDDGQVCCVQFAEKQVVRYLLIAVMATGMRSNVTPVVLQEDTRPPAYGDKYSEGASRTFYSCLLYTSPSPRDKRQSRMPSSA